MGRRKRNRFEDREERQWLAREAKGAKTKKKGDYLKKKRYIRKGKSIVIKGREQDEKKKRWP